MPELFESWRKQTEIWQSKKKKNLQKKKKKKFAFRNWLLLFLAILSAVPRECAKNYFSTEISQKMMGCVDVLALSVDMFEVKKKKKK